jgi:outer membrane protein W
MKAQMILAASTLATLVSSSAFAEEAGTGIADPSSKMRAFAQVEVAPTGSADSKLDGVASDGGADDAAVAYGISGGFDYALHKYLSVGVAPRLLLNVKADQAGDNVKAGKEIDLRVRLVGHVPISPGLEAYAALTPGYSILLSGTDGMDSFTGFALGGAIGVSYDVSPRMFISGEVGYQRAFTSVDIDVGTPDKLEADLDLSYLHVGVGAGTRF